MLRIQLSLDTSYRVVFIHCKDDENFEKNLLVPLSKTVC